LNAVIIASNSKGYKLPAEGRHLATLKAVDDVGLQPNSYRPGTMRHVVKLTWEITQPDGSVAEKWDYKTASLAPLANLRKIVKALLGRNPGATLDLDALVGKQCIVEIEHRQSGERTVAQITGYERVPESGYQDAPGSRGRHDKAIQ
jgi:hypothetical protein